MASGIADGIKSVIQIKLKSEKASIASDMHKEGRY